MNLLIPFLSYISGILFSEKILTQSWLVLSCVLLTIVFTSSLIFFLTRRNYILISIISMLFFFVGAYWFDICMPKPSDNDISVYAPKKNIRIEGVISSEPKVNADKISFSFQPESISASVYKKVSGTSVVTLYAKNINLAYGDKITLSGKLDLPPDSPNPGEFSYSEYLKKEGTFSLITVNSVSGIKVVEKETKNDIKNSIIKIKVKLFSTLYKTLPSDFASFVASLVFGAEASPVSKEIKKEFTDLGLAHVLAASGMQVSLLMAMGLFFSKKLKFNSFSTLIFTGSTIIFYMLITGLPPSILRAGMVSLLILIANLFNKKVDSFKVLLFISFAILLFSPVTLFDIGFEFSVIATFSILYASPVIASKLEFLPPFFSEIIALILSAQIFVLPLQLYYFSQFSYLFLPANIIASLFVDLLTYLSIFTLVIGLVSPFLVIYISKVLYYLVFAFLYCVEHLSKLPNSVSYTEKPEIYVVVIVYLIIFCLIELMKDRNLKNFEFGKKIKFASVILILFLSISGFTYNRIENKNLLKIVFINVGQGSSILIRTPGEKVILIDCGQKSEFKISDKLITVDAGKKYILPYLQHNGINKIDILVLTHPDSDHIGGFKSIADEIEIGEVWDSGQVDDSELYNNVLEEIIKKDISLKTVNKGNEYKEKNLSLKVINEINPENIYESSYNNNNSIALKLTYKKNSFLFMADLEKEAEKEIIDSKETIKAEVLSIAHHGSNSSSTREFLEKVKPQFAIISAGKNNIYHHPSSKVCKRLYSVGAKVLRTDKSGGISIKSDGIRILTSTTN